MMKNGNQILLINWKVLIIAICRTAGFNASCWQVSCFGCVRYLCSSPIASTTYAIRDTVSIFQLKWRT